jgi:hypothetical protein
MAIRPLYRLIVLFCRSQPATGDTDGVAGEVFGVGEPKHSGVWIALNLRLFSGGGFEGANVFYSKDQLDCGATLLGNGGLMEGYGPAHVGAG